MLIVVTAELENEEGGHGLNIPGCVVGGENTCKEMVRMNAFTGGQLAVHKPGPQQKQMDSGISAPFNCQLQESSSRKRNGSG